MELSDDLLCMFSAQIEDRNGGYLLDVPQREVKLGDVEPGESYRVAVVASEPRETPTTDAESTGSQPVREGDVVDVEIEDIGEQGDGIARVGPGYVIIVPETELGERVSVEITEARENLAFADVIERQDQFS